MAFNVTDVQKALRGARYPSEGSDLAEVARGNGADESLVDSLSQLGEASGPDDVMHQLRGSLTGGDAS